jgi:putative membrane protein
MRKKLLFLTAVLAAFGAAAAAKSPPTGDSTALATVAAADQHEVSVARQALAKGVSGGVRDFANMMVTDHGKNLTDTRRVATENKVSLASNADVRAMEAKGRSEEQALGKLKGEAYSKAYVDAMVKGHTEVLGKLDNTLIPGASDPEVVAHLKATREAVAKHLAAAQALQGSAAAK